MKPSEKLIVIKIIHTLIWLLFVSLILYILYTGITDQINRFTYIAIAIIFGEGLVLLIFKMSCPLTIMAREYSDSEKDNFDIYLPNWLAKYNKLIFTSIFVISLIIMVFRIIKN